MVNSTTVANYVDAALQQLRRLNLMRRPSKLPESMRDDTILSTGGWVGWKPIPSTVTDADLASFELEIGLKLPPAYREFLQYKHFIGLTERGVRFERHLPESWRVKLRTLCLAPWGSNSLVSLGFLPFGSESMMDAGPVCFDCRKRQDDGDCPVVFLDHEWIGTNKEVRLMFSSASKMFECLSLVAKEDINFFRENSEDSEPLISMKRMLLKTFLTTDPRGAGGPARDYWTAWGINPTE